MNFLINLGNVILQNQETILIATAFLLVYAIVFLVSIFGVYMLILIVKG